MPIQIDYQEHRVRPREGETVLDALLRQGVEMPFSCKGGVCHTCLLQCTEGPVEPSAQRGLPEHLQRMRYLLPCLCHPTGAMTLRPPQAQDLVTRCQLCDVAVLSAPAGPARLRLMFEPQGALAYRPSQRLRLVSGDTSPEPELVLTSDPRHDLVVSAELTVQDHAPLPLWLHADTPFGFEFEVRGPFDATPPGELPLPTTDPALWHELGDGALVSQVLRAFYPKVYADAQLAPFFEKVTLERSIEKQFSFLKLCMTGERSYFGDRPRNAHHWMIISHDLFDHRQSLMVQTLREHGLSEDQIQRWTRFEEYFRPDIVKGSYWPRREDGQDVMTEGFEREVLSASTLCDHCGAEVSAGTEVLYHRRLGTLSCPKCAPRR